MHLWPVAQHVAHDGVANRIAEQAEPELRPVAAAQVAYAAVELMHAQNRVLPEESGSVFHHCPPQIAARIVKLGRNHSEAACRECLGDVRKLETRARETVRHDHCTNMLGSWWC